MLKVLFVLEIFKFLLRLFSHVGKPVDRINFKLHNIADWQTNNYNNCPRSQEVKAMPVNRIMT